jgi:hypothetical protein
MNGKLSMKINEIIIIGGGTSIRTGLDLGLKKRIRNKCTIACNFAFNHFDSTIVTYVDEKFYKGILNEDISKIPNKSHIQQLKSLPLIIGNRFTDDLNYYYSNTIPLKSSGIYSRNIQKTGIYRPTLVGLFSIHLAMHLMNYNGIIYILGYDWTRRKEKNEKVKTHYYSRSEINHRGQGYSTFYEVHRPEQYFDVFTKEKDVKIYNVSPNSNINCFEKISYPKFFELLSPITYNQDKLRKIIKQNF